MNCISECVLNVLNGNVVPTGCKTRKIHKYNSAPRKLVDKQFLYRAKNELLFSMEESLYRYWQQFFPRPLVSLQPINKDMIRKMHLVPGEKYHLSPPPKKRSRRRRQRPRKLHSHAEWIKLRTKHRQAELRRNHGLRISLII